MLLLPRPLPDGGAFAGLTAVKTGRAVVVPDPDALVRVGPRLAEGAAWLAWRAMGHAPARAPRAAHWTQPDPTRAEATAMAFARYRPLGV